MARIGRAFPLTPTYLTGTLARVPQTFVTTLQDSLTLSDSLDRGFEGVRNLTDTLTLTGVLSRTGEFGRSLQDALTLADVISTALTTGPVTIVVTLLDSLNLSDQLDDTFFDFVLWTCIGAAGER